MSQISKLIQNYHSFVRLPWPSHLADIQRVWFVVYHPSEERRLRAHIKEFETSTLESKHKWCLVDITQEPAIWLRKHDNCSEYFKFPDAMLAIDVEVQNHIAQHLSHILKSPDIDGDTIVAVIGAGSLLGFGSVSSVISAIEGHIRGRLLVFFPGEYDNNQYRFMDARDGFNYMAIPITSSTRMKV